MDDTIHFQVINWRHLKILQGYYCWKASYGFVVHNKDWYNYMIRTKTSYCEARLTGKLQIFFFNELEPLDEKINTTYYLGSSLIINYLGFKNFTIFLKRMKRYQPLSFLNKWNIQYFKMLFIPQTCREDRYLVS